MSSQQCIKDVEVVKTFKRNMRGGGGGGRIALDSHRCPENGTTFRKIDEKKNGLKA